MLHNVIFISLNYNTNFPCILSFRLIARYQDSLEFVHMPPHARMDQKLDRFHAWENLYCLGRIGSSEAESHANPRTRKRKWEIDLIANAVWYFSMYNKL